MPKACLVLAAIAAMCFAGNADAVNALAPEFPVNAASVVTPLPPSEPGTDGGFIVGDVDTIGGTTYDWLANGPHPRQLALSPTNGIHALWMYSAANQTTFPDRNMRYNFFDFSLGWNWIDPDYMTSGVNVFTDKSGYGNLDNDPATGFAVVSRHYGTTLTVGLARDMAPGGGIFEYCAGPSAVWPNMVIGQNGWMHMALADANPETQLWYSRCTTWCNIPSPTQVTGHDFPTYSMAASKVSNKVAMSWVPSTGPTGGYYRISTDGGTTWGSNQSLPCPTAYSGDTTTSFHITGLSAFYDRWDRLHLVGATMPYVGGSGYVIPAHIYHWSPDNSPAWSRIHIAQCNPANLLAAVGYNAIYACRPSIGEDANGGLFVAWEQFDSSNVENGSPTRLRADIFYAQDNGDNGKTWQSGVKITDKTTTSKRFPSIIDKLPGDTLYISYLEDQKAGFFVQGENAATNNAFIVHKVKVNLVGMEEEGRAPRALEFAARPNPFAHASRLSYALPTAGRVELAVFDPSGRQVATLADRYQSAGRYTVDFAARNLKAGIYLARLRVNDRLLTTKLVLTD